MYLLPFRGQAVLYVPAVIESDQITSSLYITFRTWSESNLLRECAQSLPASRNNNSQSVKCRLCFEYYETLTEFLFVSFNVDTSPRLSELPTRLNASRSIRESAKP
jgi:hypothetical protein